MAQTLNFYKPNRLGDTVTTKLTVGKIDNATQHVYLHAEAFVEEELVIEDNAKV